MNTEKYVIEKLQYDVRMLNRLFEETDKKLTNKELIYCQK